MFTSHGHEIEGSVHYPLPPGMILARCGGPKLCQKCKNEQADFNRYGIVPTIDSSLQNSVVDYSHMETPVDETPIEKAIRIVYNYIKERLEKTDTHVTFSEDEVYIVWFNYTLGSWKALLSTTLPDQMYYEVTYNQAKKETYLDAYKKWENVKVSD